ncbi:unnamed protein product [Cunninghamella blakesleeana]
MKLIIYTIACLLIHLFIIHAESQNPASKVNSIWLQAAEKQCGEGYKVALDNPNNGDKIVEKCLGVSCRDPKGKFKGVVVPAGTPCKFKQTIGDTTKIVDGVCEYMLCKAK